MMYISLFDFSIINYISNMIQNVKRCPTSVQFHMLRGHGNDLSDANIDLNSTMLNFLVKTLPT